MFGEVVQLHVFTSGWYEVVVHPPIPPKGSVAEAYLCCLTFRQIQPLGAAGLGFYHPRFLPAGEKWLFSFSLGLPVAVTIPAVSTVFILL